MKLIKTKHRALALHLKSTNKRGARKIVAFHLASGHPMPAYLLDRLLKFTTAFIFLVASISLQAQTNWTGTVDNDWNNAANWSAGVPDASNGANINNVGNAPVIFSGTNAVAKSVTLQANANLTVQHGASLTIDNALGDGILNKGTFDNAGQIIIGLNGKVGSDGIQNLGTFNNLNDGDIQIEETHAHGIFNTSGSTFDNSGLIKIGGHKLTGKIGLSNYSVFNNLPGGDLLIEETGEDGILNAAGHLKNSAKIQIGGLKFPAGDGLENATTLTIEACAELLLFDKIANFGTITNNGYLALNSSETQIPGTFINNGTFLDVQGNFPLSGSAINNEIYLTSATFGECETIHPVLDLGNPVDFNVVGIFPSLPTNTPAGTYDINTNTFTPNAPLPLGLQTLFVKVENTGSGCTRVLGWQLNITSCCPAPVASCKSFDATLDSDGHAVVATSDVDDNSTADCGLLSLTIDQTDFDCSHVGTPQTVVLTITDVENNSDQCNATVNVVDDKKPNAICQDITISLTSNGNYSLSPSEVFLSATDNCGLAAPISVSPNSFTCSDSTDQNVTLTVADGSGNTATCTADVHIIPFLELNNCVATDESCLGAADGSLTINATAMSGQIGYSIDGGVNFQFNNVFDNLAPGVYDIVVKVFGIPEICEKIDTKWIEEGNSPDLWYKDMDGDGYSDGLTMMACDQPVGYIASPNAGTDCDDNTAACYPGNAEICDGLDNDCDGHIPADELDADGDGFSICEGDCDDTDASVHPQATEVCDGIDNNCDGNVDENLSGETYAGNVFFTTQSQIDDWPSCFSTVQGNVSIMGAGVTDLTPLSQLEVVTGNVTIMSNAALTALHGLEGLTDVNGNFYMYYNFQLADCCAIDDLLENGGIGGLTMIFFNALGSHCNSVPGITAACPLAGQNRMANSFASSPHSWQPNLKMKLYPNPATFQVNVVFENRELSEADLYIKDMLGRTIHEQHVEKGQTETAIDLGNGRFESGIYQAVLIHPDEIITQQLIIQQ